VPTWSSPLLGDPHSLSPLFGNLRYFTLISFLPFPAPSADFFPSSGHLTRRKFNAVIRLLNKDFALRALGDQHPCSSRKRDPSPPRPTFLLRLRRVFSTYHPLCLFFVPKEITYRTALSRLYLHAAMHDNVGLFSILIASENVLAFIFVISHSSIPLLSLLATNLAFSTSIRPLLLVLILFQEPGHLYLYSFTHRFFFFLSPPCVSP